MNPINHKAIFTFQGDLTRPICLVYKYIVYNLVPRASCVIFRLFYFFINIENLKIAKRLEAQGTRLILFTFLTRMFALMPKLENKCIKVNFAAARIYFNNS